MATHKDLIFIKDLEFEAILGVLPIERTQPQLVRFNLQVEVDIQTAAKTKDLSATLDYAQLAKQVQSHTVQAECLLVETLAEDIAQLVLSQPCSQGVYVEVAKPNALAEAEAVGVRIYRART